MLRTATKRLALWRATQNRYLSQPRRFETEYFRWTSEPITMMQRMSLVTSFNHQRKVDGEYQEFSVHVHNEDDAKHLLEVCAPSYLSFDAVWAYISCRLRYHPKQQWPNRNVEVVTEAVKYVGKMKDLQLFKKHGFEIVPVVSKEEADRLSERDGKGRVVYDIGGSLTKLQGSLKARDGDKRRYYKLAGAGERESELGWGIKIRLSKLGLHK